MAPEIEKLEEAMRNEEKEEVSKKIAQDSLILLKNDGVLPIKKGTKIEIGLIGLLNLNLEKTNVNTAKK